MKNVLLFLCLEKDGYCMIVEMERATLNQKVYEQLKMAILNGSFKAGEKLHETTIAKMLNVSPTPVREAFRMLASEGLLRSEPWKGVFVSSFSRTESEEAYECREALECFALRLWWQKTSKDEVVSASRKMRLLIESSHESSKITGVVVTNTKFHQMWMEGCKNQKLLQLFSTINNVLLHDRNISANDEKRRKEIEKEHKEIVRAIEQYNFELADLKLKEHLRNGCNYGLGLLTE